MVVATPLQTKPLSDEELHKMHTFWRACNYLAVGMIYLRDNPLLREPLKPEHVKQRLLGDWGTSPGLSFIYTHLNRIIKKYNQSMVYVAGPGHGAPGMLAPVYLEGSYSEVYPDKSEDAEGMRKFFRQFSFPGGIGSHCAPETPGSIYEGGELGYSLSHAYGIAFDNPETIVACVVGDGEAETGPLATAWHTNKFLNPARDGAVLPILHLNGSKIANPTILARIDHEELDLYLDVSRMRFDDALVDTLKPKFEKDFKDMEALEAGTIANPDENRMVGYYWLRDPDRAPAALKKEIIETLEQIEAFAQKVHDGTIHPLEAPKFTDILSIGIGGSALDPEFVAEVLAPEFPPMAIHFIDNTDPAGIDRVLNRLKDRLRSTLIIITSKSGGTPETRNGMLEVKHAYEQQGLHFPSHAVAITVPDSKMDELERMEGWLGEFPMFDWVGGRTSEMTAVGLLSASLLGIDIRSLLAGAKEMDEATSGDFLSGLLQGTRQALYENHRDSITVTIPQVNPRTVGALIALYERAVGLYASLFHINAYHQPGVEAGKKAAASVLDLQRQVLATLKNTAHPLELATLAEKADATDNIETVYKIVRHLAANQRGITLEGDRAKPSKLTVSFH